MRCLLALFLPLASLAETPGLLNFQGRVLVAGTVFDGTGQFKFALVNGDGSELYWGNASDGNQDGQPDQAVSVPVSAGLYSVLLGDTSLANMAPIPAEAFANNPLYLRVWFDDQVNGYAQLTPDQRVVPAGYALVAGTVADGAITAEKLAPGALDAVTQSFAPSGFTVVSTKAQDADLIAKSFVPFMSVPAPPWRIGSPDHDLSARFGHSAIWSGNAWIIWGGTLGAGVYSSSGALYLPESDQWQTVSDLDAPAARSGHTAVWSGESMIIWGGFGAAAYTNDGGRFRVANSSWSDLSVTGSPAGREGHIAVWTGSQMLVWGGLNYSGLLGDGALYDPALDTWVTLTLPSRPEARMGATAVWAEDRLLIWGGQGADGFLNSGAQLTFDASGSPLAWQPISRIGAPTARSEHTAVWSGSRMIIWGGQSNGTVFADGALYDPVSDTWQPVAATGAPDGRGEHNAVWTGTEMIVLNGMNASGVLSSGGGYSQSSGEWRKLNAEGNPPARRGAVVGWSGMDLMVFGGRNDLDQSLSAFWRLNPQPAWYFYRKP
ncbi:galactose oxidase [Verrucomicrobia bacterium]|nr:galactose oxidase [Verrucomicrobiota bacterium]